jgi:ATP/maltotriose-dependent transcriptional regulator MalT
MLGLLDPAATDPAAHAHTVTATIAELEQLAQRYQVLYASADPVALLTPVAAHVRMVTAALGRDHTVTERRRLVRNRARVATLAGCLAFNDLGDALSGRAYFSLAADSAREAGDDQSVALVLGYTAQFVHAEGMISAARDHLTTALAHAEKAPALVAWLASIQATFAAECGDHAAAADALHRAEPAVSESAQQPCPLLEYGPGHFAAVTGHTQMQAGDYTAARAALTLALEQLPSTARRVRILVLTDLATAEVHAGAVPDACRDATTAAELLHRAPYATGAARLRAFRVIAARSMGPRALRALDEHLAHIAA